MITKGIIEQVVDEYSVKVRLPIFDKLKNAQGATPSSQLPELYFCTLPNCYIAPKINDIVFVSFEDNDFSKPFILGYLFNQDAPQSTVDAVLNSLTVSGDTKLSKNTTIGDVNSTSIACLENCDFNIKKEDKVINDKINEHEKRLDKLETLINNQIQLNSDIALMSMWQQRLLWILGKSFDKYHPGCDFSWSQEVLNYPILDNKSRISRFTDDVPSSANSKNSAAVGTQPYDINFSKQYKEGKIRNIDGSKWGEKSFGHNYKQESKK